MSRLLRALLWLTQFELAIARSTGRNPGNIAALSADEDRWKRAILMQEMNA